MNMELRLMFPPTPAGAPHPLDFLRDFGRREDDVEVFTSGSTLGSREARVLLRWSSKGADECSAAFAALLAALPPPKDFGLSFWAYMPLNRHFFPPPLASLSTAALRHFSVQSILDVPSAWELLAASRVRTAATRQCSFTDADYAHVAERLKANSTLVTFCVNPGCGSTCTCFHHWVPRAEDGNGICAFAALLARNRRLTERCHAAVRATLVPARVLLLGHDGAQADTLRKREVVRCATGHLASHSPSRLRRRTPLSASGAVAPDPEPAQLLSPNSAPSQHASTRILSLPAELLHLILRYVSKDPDALSGPQWARLFKHAVDRTSLQRAAALAVRRRPPFAKQMDYWLDSHDFVWDQPIPR